MISGLLAASLAGAMLVAVPRLFGEPQGASPAATAGPIHGGVGAQPARMPMGTLIRQTKADEMRKSEGCLSAGCHVGVEPMHPTDTVRIGCTDCHGGDARTSDLKRAHVFPKFPSEWPSRDSKSIPDPVYQNQASVKLTGANPVRPFSMTLREDYDFIRFVNPGDLRVAQQSCGEAGCHNAIVYKTRNSLMTHGAFLWGAVLYNNGAVPNKDALFGDSFDRDGNPQKLVTVPPPTLKDQMEKGVLPYLLPVPQFEAQQPGNTLRVFERGDGRLSNRGFGTLTRTDPVFQGMQRTRLFDPLLSLFGTNDHPGDYRASGCSGCHVVYANDRDRYHSGPYARFGNEGHGHSADKTIPRGVSGHPVKHQFTRQIPSSQCVVCHNHPGTSYAGQYFGYTWWDNESDGEFMYPEKSRNLGPEEVQISLARNPEAASLRGKWGDVGFLKNIWKDVNPKAKTTQFADFHGHGWVYRAVFKHDRKGNLLDAKDKVIPLPEFEKWADRWKSLPKGPDDKHGEDGVPVHLRDIHLEKGMHCVDCHFEQDSHGDGKLYGEARAAIEIDCIDCHGSVARYANLRTSNSAAPDTRAQQPKGTRPAPGHDLSILRTPFGTRRFEWVGDRLFQRSMVEPDREWAVSQVKDSVTPGHPEYNEKSSYAKTIQRDNRTWGVVPTSVGADSGGMGGLAHGDDRMSCYTCHSSWMTSCFGCHLSMKANAQRPNLHYTGGGDTRNFTTYNYQVLRDDVFMLGQDSSVKNNRIVPVRSSSAILVASQNQNREWLYSQQQTISSEGYSGQAFNPHFPHTVRTTETRACSDCHVSQAGDNNAWMAQLTLQGTNFVNFMGRFVYVGLEEEAFEAIVVTERDEPQAVIGSSLHKLAYPEKYKEFVEHEKRILHERYEHPARETHSVQLRGEYLYVAKGKHGIEVYDVANIDNKALAERIVSAPVSPLGQRFYFRTKDAAWVASPTTLGVDPARVRNELNEEQPISPVYAYLYVADREEGLVMPFVATLLDGDPRNNFIRRKDAVVFNPNNLLKGAHHVVLGGNYAYVSCDAGVVVVDVGNPKEAKHVATIPIKEPGHVAIQFRYAFVLDHDHMYTVDITDPTRPAIKAKIEVEDAHDIYLARTYAYIAAGRRGLALVDIEKPEQPGKPAYFDAGGQINDAHQVRVGMTAASLFAYIADGKNGLRVLEMATPMKTAGLLGFSPEIKPENISLIATYKTKHPAVALSKGLDRDRAVDESGNQLAVFGRRGAKPLSRAQMDRLYRLRNGQLYTVTDRPSTPPKERPTAVPTGGAAAPPPGRPAAAVGGGGR